MIWITIIEDDEEIRESLVLLINGTEGFKCISDFENCESALEKIWDEMPDVILMDINLPGMNGIEGVKKIREKNEEVDILMLTVHKDDEMVFDSLYYGACGYLMKNTPPEKIIDAIKEVREGGAPMSTNIAKKLFLLLGQRKK